MTAIDVRESKAIEGTGLLEEELPQRKRVEEALQRSLEETARGQRLLLLLALSGTPKWLRYL